VILVDTSVWVALLRDQDEPATTAVRAIVSAAPQEVATTEQIVMELLAGVVRAEDHTKVEELLASLRLLRVDPARDYTDAAALYRGGRASGQTVRALADCLVAAIALRTGAELWHRDGDFEVLARVAGLRTRDLRKGPDAT